MINELENNVTTIINKIELLLGENVIKKLNNTSRIMKKKCHFNDTYFIRI